MTEKSKKKKAILSKSTFIKGLQCEKALYLYKNRYFLRDPLSAAQRAKFSRGTDVGIYARELFPGGVDASPKTHFQMAQSVEKTALLMQQPGVNVIYEAAFEHEEVIVALDILYRENNRWKGIEVKSSRGISETYRWDAALQYYVITGSGTPLDDFSLAYVNTDYRKQGALDVQQLFHLESMMALAEDRKDETGRKISALKDIVKLKSSPLISIGEHCHNPYTCEFIGHCWKKVPADSVFQLNGISNKQKFEWYHAGIVSVTEVPSEIAEQDNIVLQIQSILKKEVVIDKAVPSVFADAGEKQILLQLFGFAPVIPVFEGTHPYQVFPFGWGISQSDGTGRSVIVENPSAFSWEHLLTQLLEAVIEYDTIWVFNSKKHIEMLDNCADFLPGKREVIAQVKSKLKDLYTPLESGRVVFAGLSGSPLPETILQHFGVDYVKPPQKLVIPEEADALYQKLLLTADEAQNETGLEMLKEYMKVSTENLYRLYNLWMSFN